jgi:hypothetical protein
VPTSKLQSSIGACSKIYAVIAVIEHLADEHVPRDAGAWGA